MLPEAVAPAKPCFSGPLRDRAPAAEMLSKASRLLPAVASGQTTRALPQALWRGFAAKRDKVLSPPPWGCTPGWWQPRQPVGRARLLVALALAAPLPLPPKRQLLEQAELHISCPGLDIQQSRAPLLSRAA